MSSTTQPSPQVARGQGGEAAQGGFWTVPRLLLAYFVLTSAFNFIQKQGANEVVKPDNALLSPDGSSEEGGSAIYHESPTQFQQTFLNIDANAKLPVFPITDINGKRLGAHRNVFKSTDLYNMYLYITNEYYFDLERHGNQRVWALENIPYNWTFNDSPELQWNVSVTAELLDEYYNDSKGADTSTPRKDEGLGTESGLDSAESEKNDTAPSTRGFDPTTRLSVYAHVFLVKNNQSINTSLPEYNPNNVAYDRFNLIRLRKRKVQKKKYKLLESKNDTQDSEPGAENELSEDDILLPYFCPTLDIAVVMDIPPFKRNDIPAVILPLLHFNDLGAYFPVIYHNDFFLSSTKLIEVNESLRGEDLLIQMSYSHFSFMRWHLQTQMEQQWKAQSNLGASSERETDLIRDVLFDTNPILLVITFVVSILHSLFDFLAFKNDIQFWRKKKNMMGMSVKSLCVNSFFQTVIFLYLMDNDTSWMILISSGVGLLIEYWKLGKAFNVSFVREKQKSDQVEEKSCIGSDASGINEVNDANSNSTELSEVRTNVDNNQSSGLTEMTILGVTFNYKLSEGYAKSKTKEYDAIATTHLLYLVIPLVCGYSIYSLLHISHKSFYSWFLSSLVGFVYAFGFVLMTPQLFINYKLQSVAHMVRFWEICVICYCYMNIYICFTGASIAY